MITRHLIRSILILAIIHTVGAQPLPPIVKEAKNIGRTSFIADWNESNNTIIYTIDVSLRRNFSSFSSGRADGKMYDVLSNIPIIDNSEILISNLSTKIYYYRVRALNEFGSSSVSGTMRVSLHREKLAYSDGEKIADTHRYSLNVVIGDIDGDGKKDIVRSSRNSFIDSITYHRQLDNLEFDTAGEVVSNNYSVYSMRLLNVDNSGSSIVAFSSSKKRATIFVRESENDFRGTDVGNIRFSNFFYTGDIDGDGIDDAIYTNGDEIVWIRNNGDGTVSSPEVLITLPDGYSRGGSVVHDIDGDGDGDIVMSTFRSDYDRSTPIPSADYVVDVFRLYENVGVFSNPVFTEHPGVFASIPGLGFLDANISIGDLDNDGLQDLVVGSQKSHSSLQNSLYWYRQEGDMFFSEPKFIANHQNFKLHLVDSDLDGNLDILSGFNSTSLFKNLGDGDSFQKVHTFKSHGYGTNLEDLDNNGIVDVVYNKIVGGTGNIVNRVSEIHWRRGDIVFSPTPLPASVIDVNSFRISWNRETRSLRYYLEISNDPGFNNLVDDLVGQNNRLTNLGYAFDNEDTMIVAVLSSVTINRTYYYRLRSEGSLGQLSPYSNYIEVVLPSKVPSVPESLDATAIGESSFRLHWKKSTDATHYGIDVSLSKDFVDYVGLYNSYPVPHDVNDSEELFADNNGLYIEVTGIVSDRYYYRVRAYNDDVSSPDYSNTIEVLLNPYAPEAYIVSSDDITDSSFIGRWSDVDTAYNYEIQVSEVYNFNNTIDDYNNKDLMSNDSSFVIGLDGGKSYYYRVRSRIDEGSEVRHSSYSNTISLITLKIDIDAIPLTLAATDIKDSSFVGNWSLDGSYSENEVSIHWSKDIDFASLSSSITVASSLTNTTITGLGAGTIYYYRVSNSDGSINGNIVTLRTLLPPPNAKKGLGRRTNSFLATWDWDSIKYADATLYYELVISKNDDLSDSITLISYGINYRVDGLEPGKKYYYGVRARSNEGFSIIGGIDGSINSFPSVELLPSAPKLIEDINPSNESFLASWKKAKGAGSYRLQLSYDINFNRILPGADNILIHIEKNNGSANLSNVDMNDERNSDTSVVLKGLKPGYGYYYRVWSIPANGSNELSDDFSFSRQVVRPNAPKAISPLSIYDDGFIALWQATSAADAFLLELSKDENFEELINDEDIEINGFNYVVRDLMPERDYYYRIRARSSSIVSDWSNIIKVRTNIPVPVVLPAVVDLSGSFIIEWNPLDGIDNYEIDISDTINFFRPIRGYRQFLVQNNTIHRVEELADNSYYYYRVRSISGDARSDWSSIQGVLTSPSTPILNMPSNLTSSSFQLTWSIVERASYYQLDVSKNPDFSILLGDYSKLQIYDNSIVIGNLEPGTNYYYRLRSGNGSSLSNYTVGFVKTFYLDTPLLLEHTDITEHSFVANWQKVTNADNYVLQVTIDKFNLQDRLEINSTTTSVKIDNLLPGTIYYYRARSENMLFKSAYSEWRDVLIKGERVTTLTINSIDNVVSIYPNPVIDNLYLKSIDNNMMQYRLLSADGVIYDKSSIDDNLCIIQISDIPIGIYWIEITMKDNSIYIYKILKN